MKAYKLARPDGYDFYTGKTINYRENIGGVVKCPNPNPKLGTCSNGVMHASKNPNDCFVGAKIPCSAYLVEGKPRCGDKTKQGFTELRILEEILDPPLPWHVLLRDFVEHSAYNDYDWTIPNATALNATTVIRVKEALEASFDDVADDTASLTIQGGLTASTPSQDWNTGDTNRNVQWLANGNFGKVWLFLFE